MGERCGLASNTKVRSAWEGVILVDLNLIAMHLETLLYMLVQSDKIRGPPGAMPDFKAIALEAKKEAVPNEWVRIPSSSFSVGMDDLENNLAPDRYFGWDNEKPSRQVKLTAFEAKARPITNHEFAQYLDQTQQYKIPASWASSNEELQNGDACLQDGVSGENGHDASLTDAYLNDKSVRTVYGLVPLKDALDWPVLASFDELNGCAKWMNGRIPTVEEAQSIYHYAENRRAKEAEQVQVRTISAVNG